MKKQNLKTKNLFLLLLVSSILIYIQDAKSINKEYPDQDLYGRKKLEFYIQKSQSFINESSIQVRQNAVKAFNLASANHDTIYIALAYSYIGASYVMENHLDTAILLLENAELFALKSGEKDPLIRVYNNLGTIYELNKNYNTSYSYYSKANKIIKDNHLSRYYKPRLSLASMYCKMDERDKAIKLLTEIINDAHSNSELYFELLARLNLIETKIIEGDFDLNMINFEFQNISEVLENQNFDKLRSRYLQLEVLLSIENSDLQKALGLIEQLPYISIDDKKTKLFILGKIKNAYQQRDNFKKYRYVDSIQNQINNELLKDFEYQISMHSNALYELSNQKLILNQIQSDKSELEKKLSNLKTLYLVSIVALFVIFSAVFILFYSYNRGQRKKAKQPKYEPDSFQSINVEESFIETFEFCPIFKLDKKFNYVEANQLFYKLSGKESKQSLRGNNDFDLPWKEESNKLVSIYKKLEKDLKSKYITEDIFNCNSEILFLPLLKDEQFVGILGILIPINRNLIPEMKSNLSMKTDGDNMIRSTKILLVDDELDNIILIKRLLKKHLCTLWTASSGKEALSILSEEDFDFVLMDLEMPDMNGPETVRNIDADKRSKFKLLALTAHSKNEILESDLKLFDDILTKPISRNMLVNKLSLPLQTSEK